MEKRAFIKLLGRGITSISLTPSIVANFRSGDSKTSSINWVWMSMQSLSYKKWINKFSSLKACGIHGILIQGDHDFYRNITPLAKQSGLEVHAWIVALNNRDPDILKNHPDWYTVSREGKSTHNHQPYVDYYSWLCPNRNEVQEYLSVWVNKIAGIKKLDGVYLDYIRYSDVILPRGLWSKYNLVQDREYPEFDFCYCEICRNLFREQEGVDPLDLEDPSVHNAWRQFRMDSVTNLVNMLADMVHAHSVKLSAAVFPTPDIAKKLVRQDWTNWNLDTIHPMIYHNFYEKEIEWIEEATKECVDALNGKYPIYSGLYIPEIPINRLRDAIRAAFMGGANGVTLFNENSMSKEHWIEFADLMV